MLSVVIRVRNAERDLKKCLEVLRDQLLPASILLECVVVDNESTDASVQIAEDFSAQVESISRKDFTWGRALNRGILRCQGEFVLLISADVEPLYRDWLDKMLAPFAAQNVVAVYGRQIPRVNAPIDEVARLGVDFPEGDQLVAPTMLLRTPTGRLRFLSNACALIRRSAWEQVRFNEASAGAEEQVWMEELLRQGYSYVYAASATAYHSHRDPIGRGGYRLWELHRESLIRRGKSPSLPSAIYAAGSICKRRLRNVVTAKASLKSKVEGIFTLPLEIAAFLASGFLEGIGVDRLKVRNFMWR